ncbi:hypothetical protein SBA3_860006 [Candidatus Sulfopaludibacter sp. SbA3]|nr:hypothetical protein SBA3_860006 [Candidatus Sulfopaludibacter sp. SbA3]
MRIAVVDTSPLINLAHLKSGFRTRAVLRQRALFFSGDERRARKIADRMGRTAVGTLRLLARLNLEG